MSATVVSLTERPTFLAIDFETANRHPDSACAVGLVRVENGVITRQIGLLLRPPEDDFEFSWLHGITWDDVKDAPTFAEAWPTIQDMMSGMGYLAAHNASFDRTVLRACCQTAGARCADLPFACTVRIARRLWRIRPTKLSDVCVHLDIPLKHHDALSDAKACARILLAAAGVGQDLHAGFSA